MSSLRAGPRIALALSLSLGAAARPYAARADEAISAPRLQYAREQARKGVAYVKAQRWAEGRQALREAIAVREVSVLLYYLGLCELSLGNLRDAERQLRRALELARAVGPAGESAEVRRQVIEDATPPLREVEARLPHVLLRWAKGPPPGATLTLDGEALEGDEASGRLGLDPGEHTLVARAPEHRPREMSFRLDEREERELSIALERETPAAMSAPLAPLAAAPKAPEGRPSGAWHRPAGFVGLGLGAALLGTGVFSSLRVQTLEKRFDTDAPLVTYRGLAPAGQGTCGLARGGYEAPPGGGAASAAEVLNACDEAKRFAALQYIFYGAGAAFAAAGAYFAFLAPGETKPARANASWRLMPVVGPAHQGLGLVAPF